MKIRMEKIKTPLIFVTGVVVGIAATWVGFKEKYEQQAQEEIDSVKETFARISQEAIEKAAAAKNKPDISVYTQALQKSASTETTAPNSVWTNPTPTNTKIEDDDPVIDDDNEDDRGYLYEITPSEFANYTNDRTRITVTRFMDDIYVDEMYNQIDPKEFLDRKLVLLDDTVPVDPIDYIRRMPKDEVCIRNFELNMDIDVYTEDRSYSDFTSV